MAKDKEKKAKPQKVKKKLAKEINVLVKNADAIVYQGPAKYITTMNNFGNFDVYPGHANFISIIRDKITVILPDGGKNEIPIDYGVIRVFDDQVDAYLGIEAVTLESLKNRG